MSSQRAAWSIVCDDIRQEVGNKISFMGIYQSELLLAQFPSTLPRLCFAVYARTPASQPFKQLLFKIFRDDEQLIAEGSLDVATITPSPPSSDGELFLTGTMLIGFSPMILVEPCKLSARVFTEAEVLKAGSILVRKQEL